MKKIRHTSLRVFFCCLVGINKGEREVDCRIYVGRGENHFEKFSYVIHLSDTAFPCIVSYIIPDTNSRGKFAKSQQIFAKKTHLCRIYSVKKGFMPYVFEQTV